MVFFSVVCLFALFFAALFFIIWIVKAILKKKTKMWLAAIVSFVIAISSFLAYGFIHDSQETKATSTIYSNETTTQAIITERTSFAETTDYSFAEVTTTTHPQTTVEISSTIPSSSETERTSEVTKKKKKNNKRFLVDTSHNQPMHRGFCSFYLGCKSFLKREKNI